MMRDVMSGSIPSQRIIFDGRGDGSVAYLAQTTMPPHVAFTSLDALYIILASRSPDSNPGPSGARGALDKLPVTYHRGQPAAATRIYAAPIVQCVPPALCPCVCTEYPTTISKANTRTPTIWILRRLFQVRAKDQLKSIVLLK
ncbi:hypothetical protein CBL_05310 [Carabus blaptoides fortunei]